MNRALNADAPVNQSVERAVRLLGFFSPEEPELTLARLTELLGTSKATTHRYTLALRRVGLLRHEPARGVYTLGPRIVELIRIRSAQLGECQPCMQSRKHESITDEDVACLVAPGGSQLTDQERLAVEFLDLLSADHHAIDDDMYRRLGEVFTTAQIVELGFTCANTMGLHRFIHTLDVFGASAPVIAYDPAQVDAAYTDTPQQTTA